MLRVLLVACLVMLSAGSAAAATLDKMTCTQNEVVVLRFGTDRTQKRNAAAEIRFESNAMFAKDANGQQHEYPVQFISGPRYQAANWTMIFNPDLTSADVALVTMTDVQTMKWRCQKNK